MKLIPTFRIHTITILSLISNYAFSQSHIKTVYNAQTGFGKTVASVGDVNGDNFGDVVIGSADGNRAYVYLGNAKGLDAKYFQVLQDEATPDQIKMEEQTFGFGSSVASIGDINKDGYNDIAIGAPSTHLYRGRAFIYLGGPMGFNPKPNSVLEGEVKFSSFGAQIQPAGDVNHDGYADLLITAPSYDSRIAGKMHLYLGGAKGVSPKAAATFVAESGSFRPQVIQLGDVNHDGFDDLLMNGTYSPTGSKLEPTATSSGKLVAFSKAGLYLGAANGLETTCTTTYNSSPLNKGVNSVVQAGDINNDGFRDVLIGGWAYGSDGVENPYSYLHLGSASGINELPADSILGAGRNKVVGADDVNHDGYSDIIAGEDGKFSLYLGKTSGFSKQPLTISVDNRVYSHNSFFPVGDVNHDGFADIMVGMFDDLRNLKESGKVFLFLGNSTGISSVPASTLVGELISSQEEVLDGM